MNCKIDCETLICERCGKLVKLGCNIKRNCIKDDERISVPVFKKNEKIERYDRVGTELKKLLSKIGIKADSGCKCSDRAKHMDYMEQREPGWCERNIDTIVGWLEEEAKKRKLPFIKTIAKMIVKRAIKNSKQS